MTKYKFTAGQKVHEFILLQRVRSSPSAPYYARKQWSVRCVCGKRLTIPQAYLTKANPKRHCGCLDKTIRSDHRREYRIWLLMNMRCQDPNHVSYKHYGGRGIQVCAQWHKSNPQGFHNFFSHIGPAPSMEYTLDRIKVDGNYEPGNVRWATRKEQANNKRPKIPK